MTKKKTKHEEAEEVKGQVESLIRDIRLSLGQLEFREQAQSLVLPPQPRHG